MPLVLLQLDVPYLFDFGGGGTIYFLKRNGGGADRDKGWWTGGT